METPVYLDYNATTPIDPEVKQVMQPYLDQLFGNPSSMHSFGTETRQSVENARKQMASLLNCIPDEVIFTSGGTESNNFAIKGVAFENQHKGKHIITSQIEHPAVSEVCLFLESQGFSVTWLPVNEYGMISVDDLKKSIQADTILITIMHANNETGVIQPIEDIGQIAQKQGIVFHSDASQSIGKIPVDVQSMGVDMLSVAGHKFYAPKGVGALFVKQGVKLQKLMHGADHEHNWRAGTENILEISGLGKAAEIARRDFIANTRQMLFSRNLLFDLLKESIPSIRVNGHPEKRLPNTLNISILGVDANVVLDELQDQVAASAGAACHADNVDVSSVLHAMKVPLEYARGTIRFSTGKKTTEEQIRKAAESIITVVRRLSDTEEQRYDNTPEVEGIVKLTRFTQGLGCACKIRPQYLEKILQDLPPVLDKNVLVGTLTSDDAAVYLIREDMAIVQTLDFFTPVVDDPYTFGAIAAANALSDIYAMGARPLFALNIVGFPSNRLPVQVLKDILKGASDKAAEAGIFVLGGHSVDDPEPKFGMVVTGMVHPDKILTNSGAKPGDALILTKPIGTGIISTAVKRKLAGEQITKEAIEVMSSLNADAAALMSKYQIHACTDVTGFGLLGHLNEMIKASQVSCTVYAEDVPVIPGVYDLAMAGAVPGGSRNNLDFVEKNVRWAQNITDIQKITLADAQTSGGLLIAVSLEDAEALMTDLEETYSIKAKKIGNVQNKTDYSINVF